MAKLFDRVVGKLASLAEGLRSVKLLEVGAKAPDFEVKAHDGSTVKLSDYRGKKVILWFYPKADTPG
jgi:peroxiredoxin